MISEVDEHASRIPLRRAPMRLIQAVLRFPAVRSTVFAFMAAATASTQTSGGSIRGTVSDPSGALVPGAGITIEEVSTSEKLEAGKQQRRPFTMRPICRSADIM